MLEANDRLLLETLISQSKLDRAMIGQYIFAVTCCSHVFGHENVFTLQLLEALISQSRLVEDLARIILEIDDVAIRNRR